MHKFNRPDSAGTPEKILKFSPGRDKGFKRKAAAKGDTTLGLHPIPRSSGALPIFIPNRVQIESLKVKFGEKPAAIE